MELPHPKKAAKQAGLRYVSDDQPGFRRARHGKSFTYLKPNGQRLRDARQLERIKSLAIPPAWENVWICTKPNGHLQATGIDARGRKQYRYHAQWTSTRNEVKFDAMADFASALPGIRRRVRRDINRKGLPKEKVVACVVRLMDNAMIRVGNDEYARDNKSYGLTTIRNNHVKVNGDTIKFNFKGKSGQRIETSVRDPRAAKVIRKCQDLPGQEVFEYIDDTGKRRDITSGDVNEYLCEITGRGFTAKDFRTWGGTVVAAQALQQRGPRAERQIAIALARSVKAAPPNGHSKSAPRRRQSQANPGELSQRELKQRCNDAIKQAAEALGNRVATCRKFYVHPKLADCYADGRLDRAFRKAARQAKSVELSAAERAIAQLMTTMNGKT